MQEDTTGHNELQAAMWRVDRYVIGRGRLRGSGETDGSTSLLAALGTDFKTPQELIGHLSGEATQIYVLPFNPNKRSAIEKLMLPRRAANA